MSHEITRERAMGDLAIIRQQMEDSLGASLLREFLVSLGPLFLFFGVAVMLQVGILWKMSVEGTLTQKGATISWVLLILVVGVLKVVIFRAKGKKKGFGLNDYRKLFFNRIFLSVDLPLELGVAVIVAYFIHDGAYKALLPMISLTLGMFFASFGGLLKEKGMMSMGYVSIALSVGGFFFCRSVYLYTALAFGLYNLVFGIVLLRVSRREQVVAKDA